ncbi:MAG TPA: hypothetical protein VH327_03970 [Gammaproteobacteria bacterium]|jgi:hypothetical protein|nr:hypothetical protein [Gammaproteobacteria bacterium]
MVAAVVLGTTVLAQDRAGTVTLACAQSALRYKLNLSVDLDAKTAAAWFKPATQGEAHKVPATITDSLVAWTLETPSGDSSFTLDRRSGALTVLHPDHETERWSCEKAIEAL